MPKIRGLRWWMIGLIMLGSIINYLTRSTLAVAAPTVLQDLHITTRQYSWIVGAFQGAIMAQPICGYLFWAYPAYRYRNKALASYDRTHNLAIYGAYELPFGANKRWAKSGVLGALGGGWQLNWTLARTSGNPLTLKGGGAQVNAPGNYQTPDQIGPINILGGIGPAPITGQSVSCAPTDMSCHYFDPTAFRAVPGTEIRFGTTGRNFIRGPGFFNMDASLFRDFKLTERVKFQFRMEVFGVTNTPHYGNPGVDVTNTATFGVITSTLNLAGRGSGFGGERQFWFAGKVIF